MENLNQQFLEEYKRLDKLCQEVLDAEKGITAYIDEMKESAGGVIPGWADDLKTLKGLRHIRNALSHDVGTFDQAVCDEDDILWLQGFHSRIMKGTDPLSLLHKEAETTKTPRTKVKQPEQAEDAAKDSLTAGDVGKLILRLAIAGGIAWLLLKYVFGY